MAANLSNSSVRGYHVYRSMWSAEENFVCKREMSNPHDSYTVIVVKGEQTCQSALTVYLLNDCTVPGRPDCIAMLASCLLADKTSRCLHI